jgi:hypothetical protein
MVHIMIIKDLRRHSGLAENIMMLILLPRGSQHMQTKTHIIHKPSNYPVLDHVVVLFSTDTLLQPPWQFQSCVIYI